MIALRKPVPIITGQPSVFVFPVCINGDGKQPDHPSIFGGGAA